MYITRAFALPTRVWPVISLAEAKEEDEKVPEAETGLHMHRCNRGRVRRAEHFQRLRASLLQCMTSGVGLRRAA